MIEAMAAQGIHAEPVDSGGHFLVLDIGGLVFVTAWISGSITNFTGAATAVHAEMCERALTPSKD